ncbi:MAG: dienelactone hydrolase family protein [Ekhidna sp.]|uniref:alpha/beta hydrolase n=1 Tax=Ekhidna sp. TaxID=2608089 RepID=UPI0032ED0877
MNNSSLVKIMTITGVVIMLISFAVIPEQYPWYYEVLLFDVGLALWLFPKWRSKRALRQAAAVLLFFAMLPASAQDYSKQVDALKQSFENKDTKYIEPHLSSELKFDPMPAENTGPILNNIVTKLPFISLELIETAENTATVKYEFQGLGERTSAIHFDSDGKIIRVELIENLIKMEMEQRKQMQASVQQPGTNEVVEKYQPISVTIPASDGVTISGNLYEIDKEAPVILLCHQAGYNKAEYTDIAPRLNEMGFNCLAIDQRSGGAFAGQQNETASKAMEMGQEPTMLDARQDLKAAVNYLAKKYKQKVVVWGSSYSSSLALFELAENKKVKAALAFSPGDYFGDQAVTLANTFGKVDKPYFVTSSKTEAEPLKKSFESVEMKNNQMHFIPESNGFHGSRVLWIGQEGAEEYWTAVTEFLTALK